MAHFTPEQLLELETLYGLKRCDTLPVRDGVIKKGEMVWWRADNGPARIFAGDEGSWDNIKGYPDRYSIKKPIISTKVTYAD